MVCAERVIDLLCFDDDDNDDEVLREQEHGGHFDSHYLITDRSGLCLFHYNTKIYCAESLMFTV